MSLIHKVLRSLIGENLCFRLRLFFRSRSKSLMSVFDYDRKRLARYAFGWDDSKSALLANIQMSYHVIEKGLTMPAMKLFFGKDCVLRLIKLCNLFKQKYHCADAQLLHAIGVIKEYFDVHEKLGVNNENVDCAYWGMVKAFVMDNPNVAPSKQYHFAKEKFYGSINEAFPVFAASRHTVRNYTSKRIDEERVKEAVRLAITTPSACNRQHWRCYLITDKEKIKHILSVQKGCRGFGHLADKVIIVAACLESILWPSERNDLYVNGGMFLMNLCYSLHYYKIAHCVLNWSKSPEEDMELRKIVSIRPCESVIALLTCGEAPDEFMVAESPRKSLEDVLTIC